MKTLAFNKYVTVYGRMDTNTFIFPLVIGYDRKEKELYLGSMCFMLEIHF